jgi:hypothetical protein
MSASRHTAAAAAPGLAEEGSETHAAFTRRLGTIQDSTPDGMEVGAQVTGLAGSAFARALPHHPQPRGVFSYRPNARRAPRSAG